MNSQLGTIDDHGVGDRIDVLIKTPGVDQLVATYFDPTGPFAGASFDTLEPGPANEITVADLLAVSFLDVRVPPLAARKILGDDAQEIGALLSTLPEYCCLWNASDEVLDAADEVRHHLRGYRGVDWVTASKLLSRKRPHLIPVTDSVIVAALQAPKGTVWTSLRAALSDEDRRRRIDALWPSDRPREISTLRLLDVAVWMLGSQSTNARRARAAVGVAVTT